MAMRYDARAARRLEAAATLRVVMVLAFAGFAAAAARGGAGTAWRGAGRSFARPFTRKQRSSACVTRPSTVSTDWRMT